MKDNKGLMGVLDRVFPDSRGIVAVCPNCNTKYLQTEAPCCHKCGSKLIVGNPIERAQADIMAMLPDEIKLEEFLTDRGMYLKAVGYNDCLNYIKQRLEGKDGNGN